MIQLNSTFFIPVDKVEEAAHWLAENYVLALKNAVADNSVMLGQLLTAVEEDHIGLTLSSRFVDEKAAEEWDATHGIVLRDAMAKALRIDRLLHFSSMIDLIIC